MQEQRQALASAATKLKSEKVRHLPAILFSPVLICAWRGCCALRLRIAQASADALAEQLAQEKQRASQVPSTLCCVDRDLTYLSHVAVGCVQLALDLEQQHDALKQAGVASDEVSHVLCFACGFTNLGSADLCFCCDTAQGRSGCAQGGSHRGARRRAAEIDTGAAEFAILQSSPLVMRGACLRFLSWRPLPSGRKSSSPRSRRRSPR